MIKVIGLLENTAENPRIRHKHGLSLYIETRKHKVLFDVGPNDLFLRNAETLGVDLADIDMVIISHGHVDHCGGLRYFLKNNEKAKVYIRPQALQKHYVKVFGIPFYAGVDRKLVYDDRFVLCGERQTIDEEITLFSDVNGEFPLPKSDGNLYAEKDGHIAADSFDHEQNLLVSTDDERILFCGCAHAGIVNIVRAAKDVTGEYPTTVIGGFHLYEPMKRRYENTEYIDGVAMALEASGASYYTCHCTGERAYRAMRFRLGDRLAYLRAGTVLSL